MLPFAQPPHRQKTNGGHGEKFPARPATRYEVITRYNGYTHVRCILETGRTHQIRVHMAYIGHPVLGDLIYGRKKPEKGLSGQCLHAKKIKFIHPTKNVPMEFERLSCPTTFRRYSGGFSAGWKQVAN